MYEYRVEAAKVVDADTCDLTLSLGFRLTFADRFRLYGPDPAGKMGLNAPELSTQAGRDAKLFLADLLAEALSPLNPSGHTVAAKTLRDKREKFGRWLACLFVYDAAGQLVTNVNDELLKAGHAVLKLY